MHPNLFEWIHEGGAFKLPTFGLMVLLGVLAGLRWIRVESRRVGADPEPMISLGVQLFVVGLLGTRVFFVAQNWEQYQSAPWNALKLWEGGLVWYGGPLAVFPFAVWRFHSWRLPVLRTCDVLAPAVPLGQMFGRIGCLLVGDDHGRIAARETWYTLTFTHPDALLHPDYKGLPLLPSQPLMVLGCLAVFLIVYALRRRLWFAPGAVAALTFTIDPIQRFLVEITRGDPGRKYIDESIPLLGGLSTSQGVSVFLGPAALALLLFFVLRGLRRSERFERARERSAVEGPAVDPDRWPPAVIETPQSLAEPEVRPHWFVGSTLAATALGLVVFALLPDREWFDSVFVSVAAGLGAYALLMHLGLGRAPARSEPLATPAGVAPPAASQPAGA